MDWQTAFHQVERQHSERRDKEARSREEHSKTHAEVTQRYLDNPAIINQVANWHLEQFLSLYAKTETTHCIPCNSKTPRLPTWAIGKVCGDDFWQTVAAYMDAKTPDSIHIRFRPGTSPGTSTASSDPTFVLTPNPKK